MTFIQITTYGPLLTQKYKKDLSSLLAINEDDIHLCQLPEFDTEMDFVGEIRCVIMNPLGNNGVSFYVMMIFFFLIEMFLRQPPMATSF